MSYVHLPVLLNEVLKVVVRDTDKSFLDCTLGEGGHSEAVLNNFPNITVCGIDRDSQIIEVARERMKPFGNRFSSYNINFAEAEKLKEDGLEFDSVLIDLGISVFHYKASGRGFSFSREEPLDMRLDDSSRSVADLVNTMSEMELKEIFYKYAEERFSPQIARKIVDARKDTPIEYSNQLASIIESAIPAKFRHGKIHPATKVFQALRIVANAEFDHIEPGIKAALSLLRKGGRLGVITFHSLEDKIVKGIFRELSTACVCPPKLPICVCGKVQEVRRIGNSYTASEEELEMNPPSRSARLRVVEKL